jgi:hypothetical protein
VNDEGRVIYAEFWDDIPDYQAVASAAGFGSITGLTVETYEKAYQDSHERDKKDTEK